MRKAPTIVGATAAAALLLTSAAPATAAAPTVSVKSVKVAYGGGHVRVVFYVTCPKGEDYLLVDTLDQGDAAGYDAQGVPCTGKRQNLSTTVFAQDGAYFTTGSAYTTYELFDTFGDTVFTEQQGVTVEYVGRN